MKKHEKKLRKKPSMENIGPMTSWLDQYFLEIRKTPIKCIWPKKKEL